MCTLHTVLYCTVYKFYRKLVLKCIPKEAIFPHYQTLNVNFYSTQLWVRIYIREKGGGDVAATSKISQNK